MLKGKSCRKVEMIFPIFGSYFNRAIGFQNETNMTGVHRIYYDNVSKVLWEN